MLLASPSDEGMQLELYEADETGERSNDPYPLLTLLKDDNENLWVELYSPNGPRRVRWSEVEKALKREGETHGEAFYDKKP